MKGLFGCLVCAVLFMSLVTGAEAYSIRDDATGGDCVLFGNWNSVTKTCTFTNDAVNLTESYYIDSDGITLDGNAYLMSAVPGPLAGSAYAIYLNYRSNVTIKNLRIENYFGAVHLYSSQSNLVLSNTYTGPTNYGTAISLSSSSSNTLSGNVLQGYFSQGIYLSYYSWNNTVTANSISGFYSPLAGGDSIVINNGQYNAISNNTIQNRQYGVRLYSSENNYIYNNNFVQNQTQAYSDNPNNFFTLAAPTGGNYWSNYDTRTEGCVDRKPKDNFCDSPYSFAGGTDYLPSIHMY